MKAIIIGGGIGGLCSALCLNKYGWQVQAFEQSTIISEIGAGIQLSPNAMQVMQFLGLGDTIKALAFRPVASQIRDGISGDVLMSSPMGSQMERQYGAPYLHIHRADLINILRDTLNERAPNSIKLNHKVTHIAHDETSAKVHFANGESMSGDIIIGADGIKSIVAQHILGQDASQAQFTGNIAWRFVIPTKKLGRNIPPPAASLWLGDRKHAVTYLLRGGKLANFVGVVENDWQQEDWHQQGSKKDILEDFSDWHPIITNMIKQSDIHYRWALFDRKSHHIWHNGRAIILGDAAHPMLPFLAQGAAMAIEDSYVLAQILSAYTHKLSYGEIDRAFSEFYRLRINRTDKMQKASKANMTLFHNHNERSETVRNTALKIADKISRNKAADMQMQWIYSHNVTEDNY